MDIYNPAYPGLYYFDTFTFTTLGTSGHRGPDSTKTYANAPWNADQFSIVDGQQQWTVPATGTYRIEAAGAYGATPGRVVSGDVDLNEGQVVSLLVGQQPNPLVSNVADNVTVGGGGGTFVTVDGKPLIVASGGDGGAYSNGYVSTDLSIPPNTLQPYISMSADGNRFVSIDYNFVTTAAQISVYIYQSNEWNLETSFTYLGLYPIKMSGDGNTITVTFNSDIYVYRYTTLWDLNTILTVPGSLESLSMNYDGTKLVCASSQGFGYIFQRTGDTWSSPTEFSSGWNNEIGVAISGDGNTICIGSHGTSPPNVYDGSGNFIANLPSYDPMNEEGATNFSISYDGSVIAAHTTPLHVVPPTGFVRVFVNLVLSYQVTFELADYSPKYIQLSYDGTKLLVGDNSYVRLYTDGTTYTSISTSTSPIDLVATSMNSSGSRIINALVSLSAPQTFIYDLNAGGIPGAFVPSGSGNGVSGSGYLTDGQVSNPYFRFLKPQAYVDGGFGNMYWYGHKGEGGFGGGQSPLNLSTGLTSVTGYKQVRPSIPLLSGQTVGSMALSEDGNTFLVTYIPYDHVGEGVNVYTYVDSTWVSAQLYNDVNGKQSVSISVDGSVWLIGGDVWRNGSFETTLSQDYISASAFYPQHIRTSAVSGNGNTCVVVSTMDNYFSNVYRYSNETWSLSVSFSDVVIDNINIDCAISSDGNTIVKMYQDNHPAGIVEVKLYQYSNGYWSEQILYSEFVGGNSGNTVSINADASKIFFNTELNGYEYSNGALILIPVVIPKTAVFSRTNPSLYAYTNAVNVYAPEISLDVTVNINPSNFLLSMGSNILAVCDSVQTGNKAIVFVDMYDPTTTCTANTSVPHGYPHDYKVQITGTSSFNGTWDIVTATANTFTFQAFGGPTETSGYVSGTTTGISGGGGYTGSPGDGVSGATCYADPTVANFTDLGAASNTAGTVTISLIDPVPLKQKWTWDQVFTNTAPRSPWAHVSWSDKLGKFEAINGSSTDGLHWDAATFFELANGQPSLSPFSTAYSDTLNLYIGLKFLNPTIIYVTSNDGITWNETTPIGLNLDTIELIFLWSSELNLFVFVGSDTVSSSYDGINWTERYYDPNFVSAHSLAYSPSIHTFVCTGYWDVLGNPDMGLYSTDGITWNTWSVTMSSPPIEGGLLGSAGGNSVTWSPKLNIFIASVNYDGVFSSYSNIARSADGQTWTTEGFNITNDPGVSAWSVLWGEGLNICTAISLYPGHAMHSYDAINWSVTYTNAGSALAYSQSLQLFVIADFDFTQFISIDGIYYVDIAGFYPGIHEVFKWAPQIGTFASSSGSVSSDGVKWEKTLTRANTTICEWSPELGLYVSLAFRDLDDNLESNIFSYYSYDGKTWIYSGSDAARPLIEDFYTNPFVAWSPKLGVFSGAYYSRDGINWIQSLPDSLATAVGWSSFHGMFVAFYQTDAYYSYDGMTWNTGINSTGISGFGRIACSSSGRFVCQAGIVGPDVPGYPTELTGEGVLYSDDGINWTSPGVAFPLGGPIWVEELSTFVASANTGFYPYDNETTGWISSDGITWSAIDISPASWAPEIGRFLCRGGYSQVNKTF